MKNSEAKKLEDGQKLVCKNIEALPGNDFAPPLELDKTYPVKEIILDSEGNPHIDVGLKSRHNYITVYKKGVKVEDREKIPRGNRIHWCHPSRFELA